ncbi:MAG: porin family protein [Cyclobacteriaceae bacterium]
MRTLLLLSGLLFYIQSVQAQDSLNTYTKWAIGVKGGATFSFITATDEEITRENARISTIQGTTYGGVIRYMTEKNFGLQIEANYTEKGWEERFRSLIDPTKIDPSRSYRVNLDYLEVPLLAYGYFGKRNGKIFLNAGMYGAWLLSYDTEAAPSVDPDEITYEYLLADLNKFDVGVRGGAGLAVATKVGTFQLESTYSLGFNSVMDRFRTPIPSILQNNAITGTIGYLIEF